MGMPDFRFGARVGAAMPKFGNMTVRDAAAFRFRLEEFKRHVQLRQHKLFQRATAELLTKVVKANPVGNPSFWKKPRKGYVGGHSRRNWQMSRNPVVAEKPGTSEQQAMTDGYTAIAGMPVGIRKAYLSNPVPYMERLNKGWSRQAPAGWIDAALQQVIAKYRRAK